MPVTSAERTPVEPSSGRTRGKSPEAFRTISEVAKTLDTPAHVLRFWESKFTQIRPVKRGGGRRYYRPQDINLLRGIRDLLYSEGMTIKGVQKILREQGVKHVVALGTEPTADDTTGEKPTAKVERLPNSQGDLFADPAPLPKLRATDRAALRGVLEKLEALRDQMREA